MAADHTFDSDINLHLNSQLLNTAKCTNYTSFKQTLLRNAAANPGSSQNQKKQFNLASGMAFNDPMEAAEYLLQREYGDSQLFYRDQHDAVFIPSVFVSGQYSKDKTATVLDYNIAAEMKKMYHTQNKDQPGAWFTKELGKFWSKHGDKFTKKEIDEWVLKLQILDIIREKVTLNEDNNLPIAANGDSLEEFGKQCIKLLQQSCLPGNESYIDEVTKTLAKPQKNIRTWVKKQAGPGQKANPLMNWLTGLELSEIAGEKVEHWLFDQLLETKESVLSECVVLHSCTFYTDSRNKKHQEIDFLLFSPSHKLIVAIEAKHTMTKKAFEQLQRYKMIFNSHLGDLLNDTWTFVPVVCVKDKTPYDHLQHNFVIDMETNMANWLANLLTTFPVGDKKAVQEAKEELKHVLQILVFTLYISRKSLPSPITTTNWTEYITEAIEAVSTSDNIIFYSNNQLPIFIASDERFNKVILEGGYGSGKTFLLSEKVELLARRPGENILFLIFHGLTRFGNDVTKTLLQISLEERWNDTKTILVMNDCQIKTKDKHKHFLSQLLDYIKQEDIKHVLFDEGDLFGASQEGVVFKEIINRLDTFWIVWSKEMVELLSLEESSLDVEILTEERKFQRLKLTHSMRNARNIAQTAIRSLDLDPFKKAGKYIGLPPRNFPDGNHPKLVTGISEAFREAENTTNQGILFIVTKIKDDSSNFRGIVEAVKKLPEYGENVGVYYGEQNPHKLNPREYLSFLNKGRGVLIIDQEKASGFEWPTVIVYLGKIFQRQVTFSFKLFCDSFMRSISNVILIVDSSDYERVKKILYEDSTDIPT